MNEWEVFYKNKDQKLTEKFCDKLKAYETDKIDISQVGADILEDEPAYVVIHGKMTSVELILFIKQFFSNHPEFKEGCTWLNTCSTLRVSESMDMRPLLDIC